MDWYIYPNTQALEMVMSRSIGWENEDENDVGDKGSQEEQ